MRKQNKIEWFSQFNQGRDSIRRTKMHKRIHFFVNPCSEITLSVQGGYCVIGNFNLAECATQQQATDAVKALTKALIRVNTMPALYQNEVKISNRIGVGPTGIHEWIYKKFGGANLLNVLYGGIGPVVAGCLRELSDTAKETAYEYSKELGVNPPETVTMIAPTGTVSKLFSVTEGAHPPAYLFYLRWVQFSKDDPKLQELIAAGYPARELKFQADRWIVGFPTETELAKISGGKNVVCAGELSVKDHFEWLRFLEKHWLGPTHANQISYTLKYDPKNVSLDEYRAMMLEHMPTVKCCSIMQEADMSAYEYLPEEKITREEFDAISAKIKEKKEEKVDRAHVDCGTGGCPVDFK